MNKWKMVGILVILAISIVYCGVGYSSERNDGGYFVIIDEEGNTVYQTGWKVRVGDQCLTADNKRYEVIRVDGDTAYARYLGTVDLSARLEGKAYVALTGWLQPRIAYAQGGKIAIYHTHSDESYVPTDGKESILGAGGIYKVGDAFTSALQAKGLEVIHSDAKHDPHDDMAYERSRRTAMELIKQQPSAIFDVHRDSTPPEVYQTVIDGNKVTKVQLVVGQYGPTGKQAEDYAMQIKAASDTQHPGLIKGIFFAKGGDYNQDLHPRSMLLEVGSHTNDRPSAEQGIALFADVVPNVIGGNPPPSGGAGSPAVSPAAPQTSGAMKSMGWIVGLLIAGSAAFMFLSTGSFKEAKAKLQQFTTTEFANFLGPLWKRRKKK
jgi:stage II sporulation protein P